MIVIQGWIWFVYTLFLMIMPFVLIRSDKYRLTYRDLFYFVIGASWAIMYPNF